MARLYVLTIVLTNLNRVVLEAVSVPFRELSKLKLPFLLSFKR